MNQFQKGRHRQTRAPARRDVRTELAGEWGNGNFQHLRNLFLRSNNTSVPVFPPLIPAILAGGFSPEVLAT